MTVLTAYVRLRPETVTPALEACRTVRAASLQEHGCESYDFFQSPDDPTSVVFVEEWSDKAALDAHFQQEAFQNFFATMSQLWQNEPDIRIFEAQRMG